MRLVYSHKTVPAEYCFLPHCALLSSKHNLWERLTPMNHTMCYAHPSPHTPCMLTPDVHLMKRFVSEDEWGRSWGGENIGEESPHSECVCTTATELPIHTSPPWVPGGWQAPQHLISFTMRPISGWHYSMRGGPRRPFPHPQLSAYRLREEHSHAPVEPLLAAGYDIWYIQRGTHWNALPKRLTCTIFFSQPVFIAGSITVIVVPLTSIGEQLKKECTRLGLSAVLGGQVVAQWSVSL